MLSQLLSSRSLQSAIPPQHLCLGPLLLFQELPRTVTPHPTAPPGQPLSCRRGQTGGDKQEGTGGDPHSRGASRRPCSVRRPCLCCSSCGSCGTCPSGTAGALSPARATCQHRGAHGGLFPMSHTSTGGDTHLIGVVEQLQHCQDAGSNEQSHLPSDVTCRGEGSHQGGLSPELGGRRSRESGRICHRSDWCPVMAVVCPVPHLCCGHILVPWERATVTGPARDHLARGLWLGTVTGLPTATNTHPATQPPHTPSSAQSSHSSGLQRRYPAPGCSPCAG